MARIFTGVTLRGYGTLSKMIKDIEKQDRKKAIRAAARLALIPVRAQAKSNAPKDSGNLKKSIIVRASKGQKRLGAYISNNAEKMSKLDPEMTSFYGPSVEFGSPKALRPQKGQRYLKAAADSRRKIAQDIFMESLKKQITKLGSDAGKAMKNKIKKLGT